MNDDELMPMMLVVDDQEISRAIIKETFKYRFEVLEAENGQQALEILRKNAARVRFVILDVVMPVMDGFEFMEQRNQMPDINHIPVIVVTEHGDRNNEIYALQLGAADLLHKPFDPFMVELRVEKVLSSYGAGLIFTEPLQREALTLLSSEFDGGILSLYVDNEFTLNYVSVSLAAHLGYDSYYDMFNALGGSYLNAIHAEDRAKAVRTVTAQLEKGERYKLEYRVCRKDGRTIWVRDSGKTAVDDKGKLVLVGLCSEVSQYKRQERQYDILADEFPIVCTMSGKYILRYVPDEDVAMLQKETVDKLGLPEEIENFSQVIGSYKAVPPESRRQLSELLDEIVSGSETGGAELELTDASGVTATYRLDYRTVFDQVFGAPARVVVSLREKP